MGDSPTPSCTPTNPQTPPFCNNPILPFILFAITLSYLSYSWRTATCPSVRQSVHLGGEMSVCPSVCPPPWYKRWRMATWGGHAKRSKSGRKVRVSDTRTVTPGRGGHLTCPGGPTTPIHTYQYTYMPLSYLSYSWRTATCPSVRDSVHLGGKMSRDP